MKKWISLALALSMVLGLVACGDEAPTFSAEITSVETAKDALAAGAYEQAYAYLMTDESDEATELLKQLVFVPTKTTVKQVEGEDTYAYTTVYTYDEKGNFLTLTKTEDGAESVWPLQRWECTYDQQGRLLTSQHFLNSHMLVRLHKSIPDGDGYVVEEYGARTELSADGYEVIEGNVMSTYRLDHQNRLVSAGGDLDLSNLKKSYDDEGNLVAVESASLSITATYDEQDRLQSVKTESSDNASKEIVYTYDKNGNRLICARRTKESDKIARFDQDSETAYTYDDNGNCLTVEWTSVTTSMEEGKAKEERTYGKQSYTYDQQGRLVKEEGTGDRWPAEVWVAKSHYTGGDYTKEYTYDEQGRLTQQTFDYFRRYEFEFDDEPFEEALFYTIESTYAGDGTRTDTYLFGGAPYHKTVQTPQGWLLEEWHRGDQGLTLEQSYQYDRFGNVIHYAGGQTTTVTEWELKYYPNGFPYAFVLGIYSNIQVNVSLWPAEVCGMPEAVKERLVGFNERIALAIDQELAKLLYQNDG